MDDLLQIRYENLSNRPIDAYPITYGVPLAPGRLTEADETAIRLPNGAPAPVQTRTLERHPDGSVHWLLLDFALPLSANERGAVALVAGARADPTDIVEVSEDEDRVEVRTPRLAVTFDRRRFSLFGSWLSGERPMLSAGGDIIVQDNSGKLFYASRCGAVEVNVVESGPLRTVVQASGRHTAEDGEELLSFRVRYTFRPQEGGVEIAYKFTNAEPPEKGVHLRAIRIEQRVDLGGPTTRKLIRQANHGLNWVSRRLDLGENVDLICGSAVNESAKARYGAFADGKVLIGNMDSLREDLDEYPYFLRPGNARTDMTGGLRQVYPYIGMTSGEGGLAAWFTQMALHYPKGLRAEGDRITWDVWPEWAGDLLLRRGMSKEHDLYLALFAGACSHDDVERTYFDHEVGQMGVWGAPHPPVALTLDPDYVREVEALDLHRWLRYDEDKYLLVEEKLGSVGGKGAVPIRGMLDVGDSVSDDRSWCHNNENDAILNGLREYYRRAEPAALAAALLKARHNAHVDFIAYDPDPLRQGTMPAHCPEHTDGATYPSHMWVDGLLAAYCITGEPDLRAAALSVGENMLRWQSANPAVFYADSRECGWPMLAYLRLHEHTGEERWLDACEEVFLFYRDRMDEDAEILYALPHGVGTELVGYGEFIAWRACLRYWERTGREDVKEFLVRCLSNPKVYLLTARRLAAGGWACNDLFPAWAAWRLTGDDKFITDNYPVLRLLMKRSGKFPWGGVDVHYYLGELDRRGVLEDFV